MAKQRVAVIIRLARMSRHAPAKFGPFIKSNKWPGEYVYEDRSFTMKEFEVSYEKILLDTHFRFGVFPVPKFILETVEEEPAIVAPPPVAEEAPPAQEPQEESPPVEDPPVEESPEAPPPIEKPKRGKKGK